MQLAADSKHTGTSSTKPVHAAQLDKQQAARAITPQYAADKNAANVGFLITRTTAANTAQHVARYYNTPQQAADSSKLFVRVF